MARPRPKGLPGASTRFILWVDTEGWADTEVDSFINDVLAVGERYSKTAHIEIPLGLMVQHDT